MNIFISEFITFTVKQDVSAWGIISAYQTDSRGIPALNLKRSLRLKSAIKRSGLKFIQLYGHYQEGRSFRETYEKAFLVYPAAPYELPKLQARLTEWTRTYHQPGYIFKAPEDDSVYLILPDNTRKYLNVLDSNDLDVYYSTLRGRAFIFDELTKCRHTGILGRASEVFWDRLRMSPYCRPLT